MIASITITGDDVDKRSDLITYLIINDHTKKDKQMQRCCEAVSDLRGYGYGKSYRIMERGGKSWKTRKSKKALNVSQAEASHPLQALIMTAARCATIRHR